MLASRSGELFTFAEMKATIRPSWNEGSFSSLPQEATAIPRSPFRGRGERRTAEG